MRGIRDRGDTFYAVLLVIKEQEEEVVEQEDRFFFAVGANDAETESCILKYPVTEVS